MYHIQFSSKYSKVYFDVFFVFFLEMLIILTGKIRFLHYAPCRFPQTFTLHWYSADDTKMRLFILRVFFPVSLRCNLSKSFILRYQKQIIVIFLILKTVALLVFSFVFKMLHEKKTTSNLDETDTLKVCIIVFLFVH